MDFIAIDVETANPDMSSICQIGIAAYDNEALVEEWKTYVDPEDYFNPINVSIHGIDETTVEGAPVFSEIADVIYSFLNDRACVCHTHFDRVSIKQAFEKYELIYPNCEWLDSARVARRTWEQFAWHGYGLSNICEFLGYSFAHHDALEDAKAAAHIILSAMKKSDLNIDGWLKRIKQPIDPDNLSTGRAIKRAGNPEGPLHGEVVVFTGALQIRRKDAADKAAQIGCQVDQGVSKKTTILIVGDQDITKLAGNKISSKHRKALELISQGSPIRILRESDFQELVKASH